MKIQKRFSLFTLLLVMLLVSLVFGYLQWRRQSTIANVKWLNAENGSFTVGHGASLERFRTLPTFVVRGGFLPEVQMIANTVLPVRSARIYVASGVVPVQFAKLDNGSFRLGGDSKSYGLAELKERLDEIENRLNAIGFSDVKFCEHTGDTFFAG